GYTYALAGTGASIDPLTGIITVPTNAEMATGQLTVTVTDSAGHSAASQPWAVIVSFPLQWFGGASSNGAAYVGEMFTQTLRFDGGRAPYTLGGG
ncbi:hypothetical protein AB0127_27455, partial [Klebsiella pneumoniae]